jgi:histidine triad (HIT) family protein
MYSHAPGDYSCPFCLLLAGVANENAWSVQTDIVYQDATVTAFIGAKQWPNNRGHVIIIPNQHFENLYDLPDSAVLVIHRTARIVALAMKQAYACDGVSTRQHNEPAGNQDVWHYHLHVFPRYPDDDLYVTEPEHMPAQDRVAYARRLQAKLTPDGS